MKMLALGVVLAMSSLAMVGCAAEATPEEETDDTSEAIVNGTLDSGHPAVVAIGWTVTNADGTTSNATCSGTVVAPKTILTAGHCVKPGAAGVKFSNYKVGFGADFAAATTVIAGTAAIPHPSYNPQVYGNYDVGIVHLAKATNVAPLRIAQVITTMTNRTVTHVGFGRTVAADPKSNTKKRMVDLTVTLQTAHVLQTGNGKSGICMGDSGGPMISINGTTKEPLIVGVHSYVSDAKNCLGNGFSTRTDTVKDFVLAQLQ